MKTSYNLDSNAVNASGSQPYSSISTQPIEPTTALTSNNNNRCENVQVKADDIPEDVPLVGSVVHPFGATQRLDRAIDLAYVHMLLLGYKPGDSVYLCLLPAKYDDKKFSVADVEPQYPSFFYPDKTTGELKPSSQMLRLTMGETPNRCKIEQLYGKKYVSKAADGLAWLKDQNERGWAVYIRVNHGGHEDKDITQAIVNYWEGDDPTKKPLYLAAFKDYLAATGYKGFAIETLKGYHFYVFTEPQSCVPPAPKQDSEFTTFQKRHIKKFDSDASIHNASRLFRLAGFDHTRLNDDLEIVRYAVRFVDGIPFEGKSATIEELNALLPELPAAEKPKGRENSDRPAAVVPIQIDASGDRPPLEKFLSVKNRQFLESGIPEGGGNGVEGRNCAAYALAADLIGLDTKLRSMGIQFDGDKYSLYDDFCSRCTPAFDAGEAATVWGNAKDDSPESTLSEEYIINIFTAWQSKNETRKKVTQKLVEIGCTEEQAKQVAEADKDDEDTLDTLVNAPRGWKGMSEAEQAKQAKKLVEIAAETLDDAISVDQVVQAIKKHSGVAVGALRKHLNTVKALAKAENKKSKRAKATSIADLFPSRVSDEPIELEMPQPSAIAFVLADQYRPEIAWNHKRKSFYRYGQESPGVWSAIPESTLNSNIQAELDATDAQGMYGANDITSVYKLLQGYLDADPKAWDANESADLLPMQNGVLDLKTRELLPHSAEYRFTWSLPRDHDPQATDWSLIEGWMDEATEGDTELKTILLCVLNAVLKGRYDLQLFFHLTGKTRTGKGTFLRLVKALIGDRNAHVTTLEDWCNNKFEGFNAYQKRAILFQDEDPAKGVKLGKFKSLTGGDAIRAEEKSMTAFNFQFKGVVVMASNDPIFVGNQAIEARELLIPFDWQKPEAERRDLEKEFEPQLSALTNIVLAIPDEEVTRTLRKAMRGCEAVSTTRWKNRLRSEPIVMWLNDSLVYDHTTKTAIGSDKGDNNTLYGAYCSYCAGRGEFSKSYKAFSADLITLCHAVGWSKVDRKRDSKGWSLLCLKLRSETDKAPFPIDVLTARKKPVEKPSSAVSAVIPKQAVEKPASESIAAPVKPVYDLDRPETLIKGVFTYRGQKVRVDGVYEDGSLSVEFVDHETRAAGSIKKDKIRELQHVA